MTKKAFFHILDQCKKPDPPKLLACLGLWKDIWYIELFTGSGPNDPPILTDTYRNLGWTHINIQTFYRQTGPVQREQVLKKFLDWFEEWKARP